jgi:hypothetical protein
MRVLARVRVGRGVRVLRPVRRGVGRRLGRPRGATHDHFGHVHAMTLPPLAHRSRRRLAERRRVRTVRRWVRLPSLDARPRRARRVLGRSRLEAHGG